MVCTSSEAVSAASPWAVSCLDTRHPTSMGMQWGHAGSPSHGMDDLICHDKGWDTWERGSGWVLPEDRQSQDLLKHWSWIHSDLTCAVSHHGRSCGDMRCWPALPVNPLLIYLVHPSWGQCAAMSKTPLWSKEKFIIHILLFFMPRSVWVIFRDKIKTPESLWVIVKMVKASQTLTLMHRDLVLRKYWWHTIQVPSDVKNCRFYLVGLWAPMRSKWFDFVSSEDLSAASYV